MVLVTQTRRSNERTAGGLICDHRLTTTGADQYVRTRNCAGNLVNTTARTLKLLR